MSLNVHSTPGINPVAGARLRITNSVRADTTPQTLTVSEVLGGLASYAVTSAGRVLNLPTPAILIGSQALNGVQEGDCFPFIVRNEGASTVTLTPTGIAVMNPAGNGTVLTDTVRSYLIRIDDVTPGVEDYTVYDVTDTGAHI